MAIVIFSTVTFHRTCAKNIYCDENQNTRFTPDEEWTFWCMAHFTLQWQSMIYSRLKNRSVAGTSKQCSVIFSVVLYCGEYSTVMKLKTTVMKTEYHVCNKSHWPCSCLRWWSNLSLFRCSSIGLATLMTDSCCTSFSCVIIVTYVLASRMVTPTNSTNCSHTDIYTVHTDTQLHNQSTVVAVTLSFNVSA